MTLAHHPEEDLLLAYAAGGTDAAISLILATHLTFCPECRAGVALGGAGRRGVAGGSGARNLWATPDTWKRKYAVARLGRPRFRARPPRRSRQATGRPLPLARPG